MEQNQNVNLKRPTFLIPIWLLLVAAALFQGAGCGSDDQNLTASRLRSESMGAGAAAAADRFTGRLNQTMIIPSARKYLAGLTAESRIGQIEIPRLGVREWLVHGSTKAALEKGAGHIEGTSVPGLGGNFGVAGDRVLYSAPFLRLDQLQAGDDVMVHMPYADFTYKVESRTNVDPTEVSVLNPRGYDSVTLSTCDPPWDLKTRLIVFARLAGVEPKA